MFSSLESLSYSPLGGWEDEKAWLFEMAIHNLMREQGAKSAFPYFHASNSLKRLDSQK